MSAAPSRQFSDPALKAASAAGAIVGYGCLAAFLYVTSMQVFRWLREGQWTHLGVSDGLQAVLMRCCVKDGDTGRLAAFMNWLDAPVHWLGLHKLLDLLPASLALFAASIIGNSVFIYCRDRVEERNRAGRETMK